MAAALAAWGLFLLIAGGLAGYVVLFSEPPEKPGQEVQQQASAEPPPAAPSDDASPTEQTAEVEAKPVAPEDSQPELAAQPDEAPAESESVDQGEADDARPTETAETLDAEGVAPEPATSEESEAGEVVQAVATTSEINGHETPVPEAPSPPDESAAVAEQASEPVRQDSSQSDSPTESETPKTEASEEDAGQATDRGGEVQQAMVQPPAPTTEDTPPWQRFSAYFLEEDTRPRVAIVMTGLGMSDGITEAAIKSLPPEVTLSFSPYARNLASWIGLARVHGHEVMLDLYMEPSTYPLDDPGPQAIMTVLSEEENRKRFDWVLARGNSYVGVTGRLGSRLLTRRRILSPVMQDIADHGLLFVDDRATAGSLGFGLAQELGIPAAYSEGMIDEPSANRTAIDAKLNRIERIALSKGAAVALAQPFPVTIERLNAWIEELSSRGVALAPITAVVNRQPPMR